MSVHANVAPPFEQCVLLLGKLMRARINAVFRQTMTLATVQGKYSILKCSTIRLFVKFGCSIMLPNRAHIGHTFACSDMGRHIPLSSDRKRMHCQMSSKMYISKKIYLLNNVILLKNK